MATCSLHAIVLRKRDLGETDRIVTLLTQERGKLEAVAKGARKPGSKSSGASELFTISHIQMAEGRSLGIVTQWLVLESYADLRTDLGLLARASYLCELTDRLLDDGEPCEAVFDLLRGALALLDLRQGHADTVVHAYELRLLTERGYAPVLDACARCGQSWDGTSAVFSPGVGGLICPRCRSTNDAALPVHPPSVAAMRTLASGEISDLIALSWSPQSLIEVEACLNGCIRLRCERDLRSLRFLQMVRSGDQ